MRKGDKLRPWTTKDVQFLVENAGVISKREICRHLKRSGKAVEGKAHELRQQGIAISLRVYKTLTVICPKCSQARAKTGAWSLRTGYCQVCDAKDRYEQAICRQRDAYQALPIADRARFDRTTSKIGEVNMPPRPSAPKTFGLDPRQARRVEEAYALEVEAWELAYYDRLNASTRQRTKRMREVVKSNPRKYRNKREEN